MSIVCTTPMCTAGEASVQQMKDTFAQLAVNPQFDQARFRPTVDSIAASFNAEWSWYDPLIPFNPTCCTIEKIGQQADLVTNQMLSSIGGAPLPTPSTATGLEPLITLGILIAAFLVIREVRR